MSRPSLVPVLAFAAAVGLAGCSKSAATPDKAAEALGLTKDGKPAAATGAAPGAAAAPATPPKPVPEQLPDVVARVNGDAITKADFERAQRYDLGFSWTLLEGEMVPRARIELATLRFSVVCSTN